MQSIAQIMTDKFTARYDRLLWLPKDAINVLRVQMELRTIADTMVGEGRIAEPWEETDTELGVPRNWGLCKYAHKAHIEFNVKTVEKAWPEMVFPKGGSYRKGQKHAVDTMVSFMSKSFGGLLEAPCGAGKTVCALAISQRLNVPVLVVVHKGDLAKQWRETLDDFFPGATSGNVQGPKWDYRDKHLVTAMSQTLYARRNAIPEDFYDQFGMVVFDEGHHYSAETFEYVLKNIPIKKRMGVSATWRRRDGLGCLWEWHIGTVAHKMVTTRLTGEYVQISWSTSITSQMYMRNGTLIMAHLLTAIAKNVKYNIWLAEQAATAANNGRKVLVVSDRIDQLDEIQQRIRAQGFTGSVGLYVGSFRGKRMTESQLESSKKCDILLASYGMFNEGVDSPELDTLIFATPRSDVEQIVGRIQRPMEKKPLLIVDPVFTLDVCWGMAKKRVQIYETLNFTEYKS